MKLEIDLKSKLAKEEMRLNEAAQTLISNLEMLLDAPLNIPTNIDIK